MSICPKPRRTRQTRPDATQPHLRCTASHFFQTVLDDIPRWKVQCGGNPVIVVMILPHDHEDIPRRWIRTQRLRMMECHVPGRGQPHLFISSALYDRRAEVSTSGEVRLGPVCERDEDGVRITTDDCRVAVGLLEGLSQHC